MILRWTVDLSNELGEQFERNVGKTNATLDSLIKPWFAAEEKTCKAATVSGA